MRWDGAGGERKKTWKETADSSMLYQISISVPEALADTAIE